MTTENQNTLIPKTTTNSPDHRSQMSPQNHKMSSTLEERKGNAIKPLSLRPNRSVKKNTSLKPLGLRTR